MTSARTYILDANVFIEAAKGYYAFDIAPPFWDGLKLHANVGRVKSIDRVKDEIDRGNDQLKDWANNDFHLWFDSTDADDVTAAYGQVIYWAFQQTQFTDPAKNEFFALDNADAWVVAYAMARGCAVVTLELLNPNVRRRIPIPNACTAFRVQYTDTFGMLRDLGITLG